MKVRDAHFTVSDGILYKRAFTMPLLRCLGPQEAEHALAEVHCGIHEEHLGERALAVKILRVGFFWPTLQQDALRKVRECDKY